MLIQGSPTVKLGSLSFCLCHVQHCDAVRTLHTGLRLDKVRQLSRGDVLLVINRFRVELAIAKGLRTCLLLLNKFLTHDTKFLKFARPSVALYLQVKELLKIGVFHVCLPSGAAPCVLPSASAHAAEPLRTGSRAFP